MWASGKAPKISKFQIKSDFRAFGTKNSMQESVACKKFRSHLRYLLQAKCILIELMNV